MRPEWNGFEMVQDSLVMMREGGLNELRDKVREAEGALQEAKLALLVFQRVRATALRKHPKVSDECMCLQGDGGKALPAGMFYPEEQRDDSLYPIREEEQLQTAECPNCREQHLLFVDIYPAGDSTADDDAGYVRNHVVICMTRGDVEARGFIVKHENVRDPCLTVIE